MAKKPTKTANPESQSLGSYILPMVLSAAVGAGITFLVMSQRSSTQAPASRSARTAAAPAAVRDASRSSAGDGAVLRGNDAYDHQRWADAVREYQNAIAGGEDTPDVRTDLGNAFRFSGEPEKALEQYEIARKMDPQHENSLFNEVGLFNEVLHDHAAAVPLCEEFMRRFPSSDKLPAVQQQLARARNPGGSAPTSDTDAAKAVSKWLGQKPQSRP